ncbi:MAG: PAS domain S-box protein, partial [Leptolyngbyaceae bacterium]|nr:PAS domain S-box protein [Leptolyngbyaceae bacterium]
MNPVKPVPPPSFFAAVVDSCNDAMITYDGNRIITSWNRAAVTLFGYEKNDAIGQSLDQLFRHNREALTQLREQLCGCGPRTTDPVETVRCHRNGSAVAVSISLSMIQDELGAIIGFSEVIRVIACQKQRWDQDRQRLKQALRQKTAQTCSILAAIPDLIFQVGADGTYREVMNTHNPFCLTPADHQFVGKTLWDALPEAIAQQKFQAIQQALSTGQIQCYEHQLEVKGRRQDEEVRVVPISDDEVLLLIRDISDRKQSERERERLQQALWASQHQLREVLDTAIAGIIRLRLYADLSIIYDYISPHCEENFGYTAAELMLDADLWRSRIHPDDWEAIVLPELRRVVADHATSIHHLEYRFYRKDGSLGWIFANCFVRWDATEQCWLTTVVDTDITSIKATEAALAKSETYNRSILDAIPDLLYVLGVDGIYRGVVQPQADIDAITETDPIGKSIYDLLPRDVADRHMAAIQRTMATGELQLYEQQILIGDRLQDEEVRLIRCGADEVLLMVRDIGDRKHLETELKRSEAQNRAMLTAIPDLIYQVNRDGIYLNYVGTAAVFDFFPNENPIGHHLLDYFAQSSISFETFVQLHNTQLDTMAIALDTGMLQVYEQTFESHGQPIWEEVRIIPYSADEVLFIVRDITHRKQAEQKVKQAEQRLREAQRIAHLGNWILDHQANTLLWSDELFHIFEQDPDAFQPSYDAFIDWVHPEDRNRLHQAYMAHVSDRLPYNLTHRILLPDGRVKYIHEQCETDYDAAGNPTQSHGTAQDITDRKQTEIALQNLFAATAATTGNNFFPALVSHMSQAFDVAYALVTQKVGDQLESLAFHAHGELQDAFAFVIAETPCGQSLRDGECLVPEQLQQLFPNAPMLVEIQAEGYVGVALHDRSGKVIGNLCVVDTKPIREVQQKKQILQVFAARAAAELERQWATQQLEQLNQKLEAKVERRTAALRKSEAQIRSIIEAIPDLLVRVKRDGTCLEMIQATHMGTEDLFMPIRDHLAEV